MVAALAFAGCGKKKDAIQPSTVPAEVMDPAAPAEPAEPAAPAVAEPAAPATPPASGPATAGKPLSDAEFDALMGRVVAMFTAMGDAADKHAADCAKLGAALEKVLVDHRPVIDEAKKFEQDEAMNQRAEAWMKDHQDQVMPPMMKVASAGQKCASDPAFQRAMEKMQAL